MEIHGGAPQPLPTALALLLRVVALLLASCFLLQPLAALAEPTFYTARVAPILDRHCVVCHGAEKQKAGLRLDSFAATLRGGEAGAVLTAGDATGSELVRRIRLPATDDEVMPSDGKPLLSADEVKVIELWIAGGASAEKTLLDFPSVPPPPAPRPAAAPLAPDWRPRAAEIARLERELGLKLAPRSRVTTDGLVLRTASAPARCDDAALQRLAPLAELIVEAELARTKVTDAGLLALAQWKNLRTLDLTRTAITSGGLGGLVALPQLEALNLTGTAIDAAAVARVKSAPALRRVWAFGTKAEPAEPAEQAEPSAKKERVGRVSISERQDAALASRP